jgi:uncharacterized membrane protein
MQAGLAASTASLGVGLVVSSINGHQSWVNVIVAGLIVLVGIPTIPVIGACVTFLRRREWDFAAVSAAVLGLLAYSLFQLL